MAKSAWLSGLFCWLLAAGHLAAQAGPDGATGAQLLTGIPPQGPAAITESIRLAVAERTPAGNFKEALRLLRSVLDDPEATPAQKSLAWYGTGEVYHRQKAVEPAADAFRTAAGLPGASPAMRVTALLQLGIVQLGQQRVAEALETVTRAAEMEGADRGLRATARLARARLLERAGLNDEALKEYDLVFDESQAGADTRMDAMDRRVALRRTLGRLAEELAKQTKSLEMPGLEDKWRAYLLLRRSAVLLETGKTEEAAKDAAAVVDSSWDLPPVVRARAFTALGQARLNAGDADGALDLAAKAMDVGKSPVDEICDALLLRAQAYHRQQRVDAAIEELTKAADLGGASPLSVGKALVTRAHYWIDSGLVGDGIEDFSRAIDLPGLPVSMLIPALNNRGINYQKQGRLERMRKDFERVLGMSEATPEQQAMAVAGWAAGEGAAGNRKEAVSLLNRGLAISGVPEDMTELMLMQRSQLHEPSGGYEAELADYAAVLKLPGASAGSKTLVLVERMKIFEKLKREEDLLQCLNDLVELPGVDPKVQASMLRLRAGWYESHRQPEKAAADLKKAEGIAHKTE